MTTAPATDATADDERSQFFAQLGMYDVDVAGADLAMCLPHETSRANARGGLQGGLIATLIDIVAGRAALVGMDADLMVTTSDLTIHYLAPISVGPARASAHVLRRGRRSIVLRVDVHDASNETLAAVSTIAFAIVRNRSHAG